MRLFALRTLFSACAICASLTRPATPGIMRAMEAILPIAFIISACFRKSLKSN